MSRGWIATLSGIVFFLTYLVVAATLGSRIGAGHWVEQLGFYAVAGVAWFPVIRWIMLWSVGKN
jgi:hypothetical protein